MTTKRTKQTDIAIPSSAAAAAPARRKSVTTPRAKHGLKTTAAATEPKSAVKPTAVQVDSAPTVDEIAALAYTYWAGRGCQGGTPEEDWLRAERELRSRASA